MALSKSTTVNLIELLCNRQWIILVSIFAKLLDTFPKRLADDCDHRWFYKVLTRLNTNESVNNVEDFV